MKLSSIVYYDIFRTLPIETMLCVGGVSENFVAKPNNMKITS